MPRIAIIGSFLLLACVTWSLAQPGVVDQKDLDKTEEKKPEPVDLEAADEAALKGAEIESTGPALLEFFRKRTLPDRDRPGIQALIKQLGSDTYAQRVQAAGQLVQRGPVVLELLREALKSSDLEIQRRLERCIGLITEKDVPPDVPAAAARILGKRKADGTIEILLAYLPFADNDSVADEVRAVLASQALVDGKAHPILLAGLTDALPVRRAGAGEALGRAGIADQKDAVRKLLKDPEPIVRLRVAMALAYGKDPVSVPALIDVMPHLPLNVAWQAEDILFRLAEEKNPPAISLGLTDESRKKCRDAWVDWWKKNEKQIDLARLHETPKLLNYTMLVLLDQGKIVELDAKKQTRWEVDNIVFPLDCQFLPGDRLLVAEYHGQRVSERSIKTGEVLWFKRIAGPLVSQRLPNGNTFIATDSQLIEVDREDKEVLSIPIPDGERVMKAMKLPNGEIVCLTTESRIVRYDATGKELTSFQISLGTRLFGGRLHALPNGRIVVPHNGENKVVEYDSRGKVVWEVNVRAPVAATRLPNGNTLVTTMDPTTGAIEFDRTGNEVWSYRTSTRVTRALRR